MRFLMSLSMLLLISGGFWQIFTRWILGDPSTFTDEFLRYVLIWASMIGSAYCFYKDQHLALDLIKSRAKGTFAVALSVFTEICVLGFVIYVFIYGGGRMAAGSTNVSSVMHIPFTVMYSILPISGALIVVARILKYLRMFTKKGGN